MIKKNVFWAVLFAVICAAGIALFLALRTGGGGTVAVISINGEEYQRIDLSAVKESYDIELDTEYGHNTIHVEPGAISVTAADCPDKICVNQGRITGAGVPIVCIPHRLIIQIEGGDTDV